MEFRSTAMERSDGTVSVVDLKAGQVTSSFAGGTGIETLTWF